MPHPSLTARQRAAILACLLLAAYLLVYVATPAAIDGAAILAVPVSLIQHGTPDITVIGSANETIGSFGVDGALYSKKGVGPSLALLPLVALARLLPILPLRATAMLFNPLATLLTALLLHDLLLRKGFRAGTAFLTALIYGLGTFAIAYTKSLFGEPLAALLLLGALWLAETAPDGPLSTRRLALAGAALGVCLTINLTYAVLAAVIALHLFGLRPARWRIRSLIAYGLPLALALGIIALYNTVRFGGPLATGYDLGLDPGFTAPLLLGAAGMLFSPYRGLFWYNPVLLLALPGAIMLYRRERKLTLTIGLLVLGQLLAYGSWWSWHGGIVWGPRFLIPVLPLLMLALAPVVEVALTAPRPGVRPALIGLAALSGGIQYLGAAYSYLPYIGYLYTHYGTGDRTALVTGLSDAVYSTPALSPLVGHLALLRAGGMPENAWIAGGVVHGNHLLVALGLVALTLGLWRLPERVSLGLAGAGIAAALIAVPLFQRDNPDVQAARALADTTRGADVVVLASNTLEKAPLDILSSPYVLSTRAPSLPNDVAVAGIWDYAQAVARRGDGQLWLATWFPPASAENWQERELWADAAFVAETFEGDHRALHFDLKPAPDPVTPGGWTFGPLALDGYGLAAEGDGVRLSLAWTAVEAHAAPLTWFVHLLDGGGQIVAQQDRAPLGGYAPTDSWAPGDPPTVDRLFFPLPPGTDTSGWQVRIGVVDPVAGAPYPVLTPAGEPLPDPFVLLPMPGTGAE